MIEGLQLRACAQKCKRVQRNPRLQPLLINLQHSKDLTEFIRKIFTDLNHLNMKVEDINDILQQFGKNDKIKKHFQLQFYFIWLQFFIMEYGDIKERLSIKELEKIPMERNKQLEFIKSILISNMPNYTNDIETRCLNGLLQKSLFREMIDLIQRNKSSVIKSSVKKSQVKLESLKTKQAQVIFDNIIEKIQFKIQQKGKGNNYKEKQQEFKDMFDQILQSNNSIQIEILTINLKQIIRSYLGIQINKNNSKVIKQEQAIIEEGFIKFNQFSQFQKKITLLIANNISVDVIFKQMNELFYKGIDQIWYWPIFNDKSLIFFLINACINDKQYVRKIIQLLQKYPPNIQFNILNSSERSFILEILSNVSNDQNGKLIAECLLRLCRIQKVNLKKPQVTGYSLEQMFIRFNINRNEILKGIQEQDTEDLIYIYDMTTKRRQQFCISKQDTSQFIHKIKSDHFQIDQQFHDIGYSLHFTISNKNSQAVYKSGPINRFANHYQDVKYEGVINYAKISNFDKLIRKFSFAIIQNKNWKFHQLSTNEQQKIAQEIINNKGNKFSLKLLNENILLQFNIQKLSVQTYQQSKSLKSMMKQDFGYLIYIPSHKTEASHQNQVILEEDIYSEEQIAQNQQQIQKQKQVISFAMKFQYLGVFDSYFDNNNGYQIDQNNHILAKDAHMIDYFKEWQEIYFYNLFDQNLQAKSYSDKSINKNNFKINKCIYFNITQELREVQKKIKKEIVDKWKDKQQQIIILNMKDRPQARKWFQDVLQYYTLKFQQQKSKINFFLNVNEEQQKYLSNLKNTNIKIIKKDKKIAQIYCTKQQKEQLLAQLQKLDEIQQFVYQNLPAFHLMKQHDDDSYLANLQYKYTEVDEDKFKISMKLRQFPQFNTRLNVFVQILSQKPGQHLQKKIDNEGQYLHAYTQELNKLGVDVFRMGSHLLVQYDSKLQKKVLQALRRVQQNKLKWIYEHFKKSSTEYIIKNIEPQFLFQLKERVQKQLKNKSKKQLNPTIQVNLIAKNQFNLKAMQIDKQVQKLFVSIMDSFEISYRLFLQTKKKLISIQQYLNQAFNILPKQKMGHHYQKSMYVQLKKLLRQKLLEVIQPIQNRNVQKLSINLSNYIKNQDLLKKINLNLSQEQHNQIQIEIKKVNIFHIFMENWMKKCENNSKSAINKAKVFSKIKQMNNFLFQKYNKNQLISQDIRKYFKSLNILGKIYYGQQLPITQHLDNIENLLKNNDVVIVKVGTGSGKSTVIPPYLVGLGYSKVVVTQPRRLPCRQIFKRIVKVFGAGIAGYEISDQRKDTKNSLIYTTDGLLKAKVLYNEEQFNKIDILVIDQIHQRSANIDMLLLFLQQYYQKGNKKLKLVLCSATIDTQITKILSESNLKIAKFQVSVQRHPITQHKILQGNILNRILQICRKLKPDQQMLVFFPGVREVMNTVQILRMKFNREAFPIYANQSAKQQQEILLYGQIFISTAISQTSLTFRKLKYVIDSRISRWMKFNCQTELMETQQDYASNSSIQQRKGRLGRTCPGEYHYFVYHDHNFDNNREHNKTQLEKMDITNYIFELLLKKDMNFNKATQLLSKLNGQGAQFDKKIQYSKQILQDLCVISQNGNLIRGVELVTMYGDLGNPQHNFALYQARGKNCLINMIYLVSFLMMGINASTEIVAYLKNQYKGSDLKVIHDFLIEVANKINLPTLKKNHILPQLKKNCPLIYSKSWSRILFRVFSKALQLIQKCPSFVPNTNWETILDILVQCYKNKIFFNQSLFGGNRSLYQKCRQGTIFDYQTKANEKMDQYKKTYQINFKSLIYNKENLPNIVLSMNSIVSPQGECLLSMCQIIDQSKTKDNISVKIQGCECSQQYFKQNQKVKDQKIVFKRFQTLLNGITAINKFPSLELTGPLGKMINAFKNTIEPQRKNGEIRIDMNKILNEVIQKRKNRLKYDNLLAVIDPETSRKMFLKLTFQNFKEMFSTTKYDMKNNYGVTIEWEITAIDRYFVIKNAKNTHVQKLITKLINFFRWFADSQMICSQDFKIPPQFIEEKPLLTIENRQKIMDRVNQIVDSRIQTYIIKGWANGKGPFTKYPRTARMIAACWVLVNKFHCVIKGGFVRDWVVNGQEKLDQINLKNLLQKNPRNNYYEVVNDSVTPSDIDAQLSNTVLFDQGKFKKEMSKFGIVVFIEQDGWRKHVIFDFGCSSGGFTADLIEPYTSICHDSYDFDVNTMYIKKDHLNSIGLKIPIEYVDNFHHKTTKISLQQLISLCRNKQMKKLKDNIPKYRFQKFKARGWKINSQQLFEPICYKSLITQSSPVDISLIGKISSVFQNKMINNGPKIRIVRIESLKNKSWDETFQSITHWIITEIQRQKQKQDPKGYLNAKINSNDALLFHGTKNLAYKSIKQFGFDSRYFGTYGFYGRGAYFADDPTISHAYTSPDEEGNRYMFIVKVALGKQQEIKKEESKKLGPSPGFHSIYGTGRPHKEYIIDRWGQAKPLYLITYK